MKRRPRQDGGYNIECSVIYFFNMLGVDIVESIKDSYHEGVGSVVLVKEAGEKPSVFLDFGGIPIEVRFAFATIRLISLLLYYSLLEIYLFLGVRGGFRGRGGRRGGCW
jgi:hypothetical protein